MFMEADNSKKIEIFMDSSLKMFSYKGKKEILLLIENTTPKDQLIQ